jgi:hypothetical protein
VLSTSAAITVPPSDEGGRASGGEGTPVTAYSGAKFVCTLILIAGGTVVVAVWFVFILAGALPAARAFLPALAGTRPLGQEERTASAASQRSARRHLRTS